MCDVEQADGFFAIVNGTPPDEGVMVELGIAIALPQADFVSVFRVCSDSEDYPLNLMLFAGLPSTAGGNTSMAPSPNWLIRPKPWCVGSARLALADQKEVERVSSSRTSQ